MYGYFVNTRSTFHCLTELEIGHVIFACVKSIPVSCFPHSVSSLSWGKKFFSMKPARDNLHGRVGVAPWQINSMWTICTATHHICWISSSHPCLSPFTTASTDASAVLALLISVGVHLLPRGEEREAWLSPWDSPSGSLLGGNALLVLGQRMVSSNTVCLGSQAFFLQSLLSRSSFSGLWWKIPHRAACSTASKSLPPPSAACQLCLFLALQRKQIWLSWSPLIPHKPPAPVGP